MINKVRYTGVCSLLVLVSLNSFADNSWASREAHMQCGPALIKISAECKNAPNDSTINTCKNYNIYITKDNKITSYKLPYMPESQRKSLIKQGYEFNEVVKAGDWASQTMSCFDNQYIIIGHTTGITEDDEVDSSLASTVQAPFFNLNGDFITGNIENSLRLKVRKHSAGDVYANFLNKSN